MKFFSLVLLSFSLLFFTQVLFAQADIKEFLLKAEEFEIDNKPDEAIGEITKAINVQTDNAELYLRRAQLYFDVGKHEAVAADASKAVALQPADKRTLLNAVRLLRYVKKCGESLEMLDRFIAKNAARDDVFYSRSHSKMCLADWAGAYEDLYQASELAPDNNMYRSTLAGMLARLGDSEQALEQFAKLIKFYERQYAKIKAANPKVTENHSLSEVYRLRAGVHHVKNDTANEFADLVKFVEYEPKDTTYRQRAKIYLDHGMTGEAIADYTSALKNTLNPAIFRFERGDIYAEAGKYAEAIADYEEAARDAGLSESAQQRIAAAKRNLQAGKPQPQ